MGYFDWTANEKRQIMDSLKALPPIERVKVRDIVKDMSASDALAHLAQVSKEQTADHPQEAPESQNKPLKPSEGINLSMKADKGQNKPLKADISPNKPVKSAKDRETHAGAKQAAEKPVKASNNHPQILPRVDGDIISDTFDIETIKQDIQALINNFTAVHGIEDLTKAPQRQFMALSSYIGQNYFKHTKILKDDTLIDNGSARLSTCDRYDIYRLAACISLYSDICSLYNKAFLFDGIASFLGCSENTLKENNDKLTLLGVDIYQKRESSLSSGAVDPKTTNITGLLAALNHWHNWSGASTNRTEVRETTVVYPVLVDINKNKSDGLPDNSNK